MGWQLQRLRGQPDAIILSSAQETESESVQTAQDKFDHEMDKPEFNEDAAKTAALALASAKFNALGSQDYETMRIRYTLNHAERTEGLDVELLRQITKAVLIHPTGAVSLQLKNGQIAERSTSV